MKISRNMLIGISIAIVSYVVLYLGITYLPNPFIKHMLFSPQVYYELPTGGYIYVEDEYIRYNESPFNGTLDYQITLNYEFVEDSPSLK